jgi:hypothetical protein
MPRLSNVATIGIAARWARDCSAWRQRSWRTIENAGLSAGERDQLIRNDAQAHEVDRSGAHDVRDRPGQRVQGAALIVQLKRAVMVVGVGIYGSRAGMRVRVGGDWCCLKHIERVVVDQWDDARHLRDHKQRKQHYPQPVD